MADVRVRLQGDESDLTRSLNKTQRELKQTERGFGRLKSFAGAAKGPLLAVGAAGVAAAAGLAVVAKSAIDTADRIVNLSEKSALSLQTLQEFSHVADTVGFSMEDVANSSGRFAKVITDAQRGLSTAVDTLNLLDIEMYKVNGTLREQDDLFFEVIQKLQALESDTERMGLAQEAFGRGGKNLLPLLKAQTENIAALRAEAHELGIVMSDETVGALDSMDDRLTQLKASLVGGTNTLISQFTPEIKLLDEYIKDDLVPDITSAAEGIAAWSRQFASGLDDVKNYASAVWNLVGGTAAFLDLRSQGEQSGIFTEYSGLNDILDENERRRRQREQTTAAPGMGQVLGPQNALPTVEVSATRIRENLGLTDKQIHAAAQESMETWQKSPVLSQLQNYLLPPDALKKVVDESRPILMEIPDAMGEHFELASAASEDSFKRLQSTGVGVLEVIGLKAELVSGLMRGSFEGAIDRMRSRLLSFVLDSAWDALAGKLRSVLGIGGGPGGGLLGGLFGGGGGGAGGAGAGGGLLGGGALAGLGVGAGLLGLSYGASRLFGGNTDPQHGYDPQGRRQMVTSANVHGLSQRSQSSIRPGEITNIYNYGPVGTRDLARQLNGDRRRSGIRRG